MSKNSINKKKAAQAAQKQTALQQNTGTKQTGGKPKAVPVSYSLMPNRPRRRKFSKKFLIMLGIWTAALIACLILITRT